MVGTVSTEDIGIQVPMNLMMFLVTSTNIAIILWTSYKQVKKLEMVVSHTKQLITEKLTYVQTITTILVCVGP